MKRISIIALSCAILCIFFLQFYRQTSVTPNPSDVWEDSTMWYQSETPYDTEKIDVFYLVSTEVLSATDSLGNEVWQSQLIPSDRESIAREMSWVEHRMFYDDFNIISPYYHQFTFDAIHRITPQQFDSVYQAVASEACQAFDYYMSTKNNGRKFILAGFSQGAMLTLDILRHMTDEQYSRLIACYTLGYRVTAEDLQHPHIKAATGEADKGVVISFNSTQTIDAIWPKLTEGAVTCINPINWHTDDTPAVFTYKESVNEVHVDQDYHVLLVSTDTPSLYDSYYDAATFYHDAGVSRKNLHHWDLLFYAPFLRSNALLRATQPMAEDAVM